MNKETNHYYYIYDKRLIEVTKSIPNLGNRAAVVQSLIASYDLLSNCQVCRSDEATEDDLLSFHSTDYINFLKRVHASTDLEKLTDSDEISNFNLGYDCPLFDGMYDFAKLIAGSSLTAAKLLVSKNLQVKKKTMKSDAAEKFRPRSYLKINNSFNTVRKTDEYDMPADLTIEEENFDCWEDNENNQKQWEQKNKTKKKYETELSLTSFSAQPIAINWFGGWHHAQRDEAGGFCYVNDIVIAIQYLLKFCKRVLYIDLDIHHGNGVENAFYFSSKVLTFSLHKFEPGFYPATGCLDDVGRGNGTFYSVNAPLKSGITDARYLRIFKPIFAKIMAKFRPECIVVQCGADSMPGDPLGGFNLTPVGLGDCLRSVLSQELPTLILGGGGYNIVNTSKCWTYLTSVVLKKDISNDIPEHDYLHLYGPEFELSVTKSLRKDENTEEYLETVVNAILKNLDNLPGEKES